MTKKKIKKLEKAGFRVGTVEEFLKDIEQPRFNFLEVIKIAKKQGYSLKFPL